jgi:iron complex outermembrane recepter protein
MSIEITNRFTLARRGALCIALVALCACCAISAWGQSSTKDLANASLEDLMNIQVTSVSKQEEKVSRTAAAIFVITAEDIRRSGATNIPDLLRMVPGLEVAQINANTWAISARGFNGRFSNDLLVMVDGRSVYTPSFGGVFWDVIDMPLEDIERIEVIRGPGGSVWGVNAVNGVVNIITKTAGETKGTMVEAGGGNLDEGFATLQYGGSLGAKTDYRIYGKYFDDDHLPGLTSPDGGDGWHVARGGFRVDTKFSASNSVTVQGDLYNGEEGQEQPYLASVTSPLQLIPTEVDLSGGFVQGIWNHTFSARSDTTLQISYQQYKRDDIVLEDRHTWDIDFQNHFLWGGRQNIVWGVDFRNSSDVSSGSLAASLNPPNLATHLFSSFAQDEVAIVPDRLYVTVGTKIEHDYYTGFSLMPSASVVWTPNGSQTLWAAVSRAVRTPSAIDASVRYNFGGFTGAGGTPTLASFFGNPNVKNEDLIAYEAGYRTALGNRVSIDLAGYYNSYANQETVEPMTPFVEDAPAPAHLVLPETYENLMFGETQGLEIFGDVKLTNHWTVSPGYALEQIHMHLEPGSEDTTSVEQAQGSSPEHSAQLRSHVILPRNLSWDTSIYFVDRIVNPMVPSYTRLDTGISWRLREKATLSLVGQNLLKDERVEYEDVDQSTATTLIKRSVYAKLTWYH